MHSSRNNSNNNNSNKQSIKQTIRLACNVLYRFGIHDDVSASIVTVQHTHLPIQPELLRKAKFGAQDEPAVGMLLWRMIHHLCALAMHARRRPTTATTTTMVPVASYVMNLKDHGVVYQRWRSTFPLFRHKQSAGTAVRFVFSVLEVLGASESDMLQTFLQSQEYIQSTRVLLVLLGWLMAKLELFKGYLQLLEHDIRMSSFLPPFNRNVPTCLQSANPMHSSSRCNLMDFHALQAHVQELKQKDDVKQHESGAGFPVWYHRVIAMRGHIAYTLKQIAQEQRQVAQRARELDQAIQLHLKSSSSLHRISAFHVWLLQDPKRAQLLELFIGDWIRMTKECERIELHEKTWMAWLSSVVLLHRETLEQQHQQQEEANDDAKEEKNHFLFSMRPCQGLTDVDNDAFLRATVAARNKRHRQGKSTGGMKEGSYELAVSDMPARWLRLENMFQDTPGYFSSSVRTCTLEHHDPLSQLLQLSENLLQEEADSNDALLSQLKHATRRKYAL